LRAISVAQTSLWPLASWNPPTPSLDEFSEIVMCVSRVLSVTYTPPPRPRSEGPMAELLLTVELRSSAPPSPALL
jgi:hypothetical protein